MSPMNIPGNRGADPDGPWPDLVFAAQDADEVALATTQAKLEEWAFRNGKQPDDLLQLLVHLGRAYLITEYPEQLETMMEDAELSGPHKTMVLVTAAVDVLSKPEVAQAYEPLSAGMVALGEVLMDVADDKYR